MRFGGIFRLRRGVLYDQRIPYGIELANAGIFHVTVRAGLIGAYHAASARIMQIYGGFLAEFRGDGILAYFGYP